MAVALVELDGDALAQRGGQVLAHVVGTDREFAVAPVDEDGELDRARAPEVAEGVEGGANGAAGEEDVVDEDDDAVVEAAGGDLRLAEGPCGGQAEVVAVHRDVEGSDGDAEVLDPPDALGKALRERYAARGDTEEGDVFAALGALEDLVGDAGQCPVDLVAVEDGPGAVGHLGWRWGSTGTHITFC
ncbi:hypothetical protein GCM10028793_08180 [Nocardiopsis oceani]